MHKGTALMWALTNYSGPYLKSRARTNHQTKKNDVESKPGQSNRDTFWTGTVSRKDPKDRFELCFKVEFQQGKQLSHQQERPEISHSPASWTIPAHTTVPKCPNPAAKWVLFCES